MTSTEKMPIGKGIGGLLVHGKEGAKKKGADMASNMFNKKEEKENQSKVDKERVTIIKRPKVNIQKVVNDERIEEVKVDVEDPKLDPLKNHPGWSDCCICNEGYCE